ncbi:site-2 protease family protein [Candidatus Gottesmanbacteria bacterium]|nr:site-2 protease family protein [Candidatus Gottesmanbacteria bacterium]
MISSLLSNPLSLLVGFIALVIAITVHEFAHALVADRLGDPTPRLQGRLTLNPLSHLDPIGTIMILLVSFGWGKPVQFDPFNLKNPRRDAALISIAGPISNLILATLLSVVIRFIPPVAGQILLPVIYLNVLLAVFNLLPIHPLDGFKIVGGLLSENQAREWYSLERYGFIFLILLLLVPVGGNSLLFSFLGPVVNFIILLLLGSTS